MSFILDALRKSEGERQRDATPSLSRIPEAVAGRGLPVWAVCTIALLGVGVIGLGAALWMTREDARTPTAAAAAGGASSPSGARARDGAASARFDAEGARDDEVFTRDGAASAASPGAARGSGRPSAGSGQPRPSSDVPPTRKSVDFEAQSGAADFETRRGSADFESQRESRDLGDRRAAADLEARRANADGADGADADGADTEDGAAAPAFLPRYEAAAAGDPSLPKLNLEFHAFAGDAARRFVYINGAKYSEGSSLGPGLRIARITADGVIVDAAGRQLLLPRK